MCWFLVASVSVAGLVQFAIGVPGRRGRGACATACAMRGGLADEGECDRSVECTREALGGVCSNEPCPPRDGFSAVAGMLQ